MKRAACLTLLAALATTSAGAQIAVKSAQQAQEQHQGDPQAQEEQAGKAALQPQRKKDEQTVKGQPQGKPTKAQQQPKKLPPRRRVPAIIGTMPSPTPPLSYGPVLGTPPAPSAPQAYGPVVAPSAPQAYAPMPGTRGAQPAPSYGPVLGTPPPPLAGSGAAGVPPPATINQCVGSQCTDTSGRNYQIGVGNAGTDSNGRLCNRSGNTVQCF